jgi:hypothetical protein
MDAKLQQRLDEVMGPVKKVHTSPSTAKVSGTSQWLLVFSALLALRIVNALTIKTFFQPDEYFQALEPAWKIAFGADSGAWITWASRSTIRCYGRALICSSGMARRLTNSGTPVDIRHHLQSCRCNVDTRRRHSCCQSGGYAHCAKNSPSNLRRFAGLLYLEAEPEGLWSW